MVEVEGAEVPQDVPQVVEDLQVVAEVVEETVVVEEDVVVDAVAVTVDGVVEEGEYCVGSFFFYNSIIIMIFLSLINPGFVVEEEVVVEEMVAEGELYLWTVCC